MIRHLLSFLSIIFFSVVCLSQAQPQANKAIKGEITGQIISDDGQIFPNLPISLFNLNTRENLNNTCDEKGNFKFSDLPPGLYQASAFSPGYVTSNNALSRDFRIGENIAVTLVKGGVITGKILDSAGRPIVGAYVSARRVRDNNLNLLTGGGRFGNETMSDDRGVYRIFGMQEGSYLVSTSLTNYFNTEKLTETRTYFPSSTRDTAQEIVVKVGTETTGIDVIHRSEPGHSISGTQSNLEGINLENNTSIQLISPASRATISSTFVRANSKPGFAFYGIADGEYELTATQYLNSNYGEAQIESIAIPLKVSVHGSDVSGLILRFNRPGEINGRVTLSKTAVPNTACKISPGAYLEETIVNAMKDEQGIISMTTRAAPLASGEFSMKSVPSGAFRFSTKFQNDFWYLKSVIHSTKSSRIDVAKQGVFVKPGEKISGLSLLFAEGAASIQGKIIAEQNQKLLSKLRVNLIPAEPQEAENLTRYFEVVTRNGEFTFNNLAPGKYLLSVDAFPEIESLEMQSQPHAWEPKSRALLRRDAEAAGNLLELNSCQRVNNYSLKFLPTKK